MEIYGYIAFGVIAFTVGILTTIASIGYIKKSLFFEGILENIILDLSTDEELQKSLYYIGGMIGNGAKTGMGLQPTRGGKFKLTDFLLEMAGEYMKGNLTAPAPTPHNPTPPPRQDIKTQKLNDKW